MRTRIDTERCESEGDDGAVDATLDLPVADPKRYRIDREQGRGGLGCVYAARDTWLDRQVAVKRVLDSTSMAADARFVREALVASRLQHPGIVPVYDAGRFPDGEAYYAMKLVGGRSLADAITAAHTLAERLALIPNVLAVAEAVAYAHDQRIIHRDLKPANVMLGEFGETVVLDWGLARDLGAPADERASPASLAEVALSGMTNTGAVMGTPGYMAPEQARGDEVDERADVYALGAMLYAVVAGRPPIDKTDPERAIARAIAGDIAPVAVKGAPPELSTIAARAMALLPDDRYRSAKAFAEDLRRLLTGQLVATHDYGVLALFRRFVRRHRAAVTVGVLLAAALAATAVVSARRVLAERDRAEARGDALILAQARSVLERDPAEAVAWLKTYPVDAGDWDQARRIAMLARSLGLARHVLDFGDQVAALAPAPGAMAVGTRRGVAMLDLAAGEVTALAPLQYAEYVARDPSSGRMLALDSHRAVFAIDEAGRAPPRHLGDLDAWPSALVHIGGDAFAVGDRDGGVTAWSAAAGAPTPLARHDAAVVALATLGAGRVASLGLDRVVRVSGSTGSVVVAEVASPVGTRATASSTLAAHARTGTVVFADGVDVFAWRDGRRWQLGSHDGLVTSVAVSAETATVASAGADRSVRVWRLDGNDPQVLTGHTAEVQHLAFAPGGETFASVDQAGAVWLWHMNGASQELRGHNRTVAAIAFAADGRHLVTSDVAGAVRVWPVSAAPTSYRSGGGVWNAAVLGDGRVVAVAPDGGVRVWRASGEERVIGSHAADAYSLTLSSDGRQFVTGGWDGAVHVWDPDAGLVQTLGHDDNHVWSVAASADLSVVAAAGGGKRGISVWDREVGTRLSLVGHAAEATSVALSPDASRLASSGFDGAVILWDLASGAPRVFGSHAGVARVAFARGGSVLISVGGEDGEVRLWDVATGRDRSLGAHAGGIRAVAVSPDQRLLATGGKDHTIRLWDLVRGVLVRELYGHEGEVRDVAFSPEGDALASAGWDRVVRVWNVDTGASRVLRRHGGDVFRVSFSPDGGTVASASRDGTVGLSPLRGASLPVRPAELRTAFGEMTSAVVRDDGTVATPREDE